MRKSGRGDADSGGEEGTYYVWTPEEVETVLERDTPLGPDSIELFKHCYDISASGNFEGKNILHLPHNLDALARSAEISIDELRGILGTGRGALQAHRSQRIAPFRDEKVLVSWNAMMIRTLAESGAALGRQDYVQAGVRAAKALIKATLTESGLMRVWTGDHVHVPAFLEDYASLGNACLSLYEATLDPAWLEQAKTLAEQVVEGFWDGVQFYDADSNHGELVVRPRDIMDNATPSGNSLAVELLLRLSAVTGTEYGAEVAKKALAGEAVSLRRYPTAVARLLVACGWLAGPPVEVVLVGSGQDAQQQLDTVHRVFTPVRVIAGGDPKDPRIAGLPLMKGRAEPTGRVYVCRGTICLAPATSLSEVQDRLTEAKST